MRRKQQGEPAMCRALDRTLEGLANICMWGPLSAPCPVSYPLAEEELQPGRIIPHLWACRPFHRKGRSPNGPGHTSSPDCRVAPRLQSSGLSLQTRVSGRGSEPPLCLPLAPQLVQGSRPAPVSLILQPLTWIPHTGWQLRPVATSLGGPMDRCDL